MASVVKSEVPRILQAQTFITFDRQNRYLEDRRSIVIPQASFRISVYLD